jgi:hypothetical protein
LDASVYGSYLEGFLQSEPSSGTTSDEDARDAIREVLLAAALDQVRTRHAGHTATHSDRHTLTNVSVRAQEGLVEEFIDQLMQRWADRPKGAVKVASNGTTSYSAAVSPPATTAAARKPSKQRKTKPQVSFYRHNHAHTCTRACSRLNGGFMWWHSAHRTVQDPAIGRHRPVGGEDARVVL